jgi:hypothetical protein
MRRFTSIWIPGSLVVLSAAACAASSVGAPPEGAGGLAGGGGAAAGGASGATGGSGGIVIGTPDAGPMCKLPPDADEAVLDSCPDEAPAGSFDPVVQWEWYSPLPSGKPFFSGSFITPLVGNFTDDNHDGEIDLCDVPDVLVAVSDTFEFDATNGKFSTTSILYLLDGASGKQLVKFAQPTFGFVTPAFGDLDGDGLPEVVSADANGHVIIFEHDGSVKRVGDQAGFEESQGAQQGPTVALYDLDGDGSVEILLGFEVFDAKGHKLWGVPGNGKEFDSEFYCVTPTAADLDGDGKLEVLFGHRTHRYDGTELWSLAGQPPGHPHVADLDGDGSPEVFITNKNGITITQADGTVVLGPVRPTDPKPAAACWDKPAVIRDFDGDGKVDLAAATCTDYSAYSLGKNGLSILWTKDVKDLSGQATATAFDFLGDGTSEAIYADETQIYVFDGKTGNTELTAPRASGTLIEYPVVADVDDDASAEVVFVSNYHEPVPSGPTVTVLRDAQDRWIPARRIWNQYSYHVTNVREDGTIPKTPKKSWLGLNTFRTNAQISEVGVCNPAVPK